MRNVDGPRLPLTDLRDRVFRQGDPPPFEPGPLSGCIDEPEVVGVIRLGRETPT